MGCGSFIGGAFRLPRSLLCAAFPMVVTSPLQDVPETRRYACALGRVIATRVSAPIGHPGRSLSGCRSLSKGRSIFSHRTVPKTMSDLPFKGEHSLTFHARGREEAGGIIHDRQALPPGGGCHSGTGGRRLMPLYRFLREDPKGQWNDG